MNENNKAAPMHKQIPNKSLSCARCITNLAWLCKAIKNYYIMADTVEFEFEKWAKDAELTSKTAAILDEEDINCITALLAFEVSDITSLEITKGQQAVLKQALLKLKNDHSGKNKAVQEPVTTKYLKNIEIPSDMLSLLSTNASSDSIKTVIRGEGKQRLCHGQPVSSR